MQDLAWSQIWGKLFLSLLFDGRACPCHRAVWVWVSFSKMQQQPIEFIQRRKEYGERTVKRKQVLEESKWQNRRMRNLPLLTRMPKIHLQLGQFSQSTCWTLAENLGHLKGEEKSPPSQVGWKKGKKKVGRDGTSGGELKVRRRSQTQESPLTAGNQLGQKGTFNGLEGNAATGLWKAGQNKNCTHGLYHWPVHPCLNCVFPYREGLGAG